jgi:predicted nucleic-acid-binding protein
MRFVDANVILRYLLDDDPQLAEKAAKILEQGQVHVPFEVMAEVVYVMQGVYKVSRQEISTVLTRFIMLPNVTTSSEPVLREALLIYADKGLDFVDSLLCSYSVIEGVQVETFDKKLKKIISEQGTKRN